MPCSYRLGLILVAASVIAGCASAGEIQRLNAELQAANQRTAALVEEKSRYCGEMTAAAARVDRAAAPAAGSNLASSLVGSAIDLFAGKPVATILKILVPDLFAGTTALTPEAAGASRELSAGLSRYCRGDAGPRNSGSS